MWYVELLSYNGLTNIIIAFNTTSITFSNFQAQGLKIFVKSVENSSFLALKNFDKTKLLLRNFSEQTTITIIQFVANDLLRSSKMLKFNLCSLC